MQSQKTQQPANSPDHQILSVASRRTCAYNLVAAPLAKTGGLQGIEQEPTGCVHGGGVFEGRFGTSQDESQTIGIFDKLPYVPR